MLLVEKWNSATQEYPDSMCLHDMFRESAAKNRDATAILYKVHKLYPIASNVGTKHERFNGNKSLEHLGVICFAVIHYPMLVFLLYVHIARG